MKVHFLLKNNADSNHVLGVIALKALNWIKLWISILQVGKGVMHVNHYDQSEKYQLSYCLQSIMILGSTLDFLRK